MPHRSIRDTRPCRARSRGVRGFTLIELLVVLVITAIVAASAVPAMSTTQTTRARVACRQVARDLAFARERSMATGTRHWLVFDSTLDTYTVLVENPASPGRAGATALTDPATGRAFQQSLNADEFAGVDLASASIGAGSEVGFDWLGRPCDSGSTLLTASGTVTLSNSQTVTIEPRSGLAIFGP